MTGWLREHDNVGVVLQTTNDLFGDFGDKYLTASGFLAASIPDASGRIERAIGAPGVGFVAAGLTFYTPLDKESLVPPPDDRPYAAYGFITAGAIALRDSANRVTQDRAALEIGATGSFLLADEIQNGLHDFIGSEPVNGWDTQVPTEVYGAVRGERAWRNFTGFAGETFEVAPFAGATLGTSETSAVIGLDIAYGEDIGRNAFWRDRATGARVIVAEAAARPGWRWRVGAGVDATLVVHDATLDGGFFASGRDVAKTPVRWRLRFGGEIANGLWALGYDFALLGPEYDDQDQIQAIGALTLRASF